LLLARAEKVNAGAIGRIVQLVQEGYVMSAQTNRRLNSAGLGHKRGRILRPFFNLAYSEIN